MLGTVTLLEGGPKAGLGLLVSHVPGWIFGGRGCVPLSPRCPSPLWRSRHGAEVTPRGLRGDKQGHGVEAGKVMRMQSLNLN